MDDNSNRHDYSKFQINLRFIFDPFCCLMKGKVKLDDNVCCVNACMRVMGQGLFLSLQSFDNIDL